MVPLGFHAATRRWFASTFGEATEPQLDAWRGVRRGMHTLVAAPTGSGKTLAAFLVVLDQLFTARLAGALPDALQVLYISPLKALSNDIHHNLEVPLEGIAAALEASGHVCAPPTRAVRTGDTPATARQAMLKRPPHILVTTPESAYILLTSERGRQALQSVRTVIVDEIHALASNRRGAHLALTLERLDALTQKPAQRIGLSATQKPVAEIARFLVGMGPDRAFPPPCHVVDAGHVRHLDLALEIPGAPLEATMSNEVWEEVYARITGLITTHQTTLIFVNTRRQAERVAHRLSEHLGTGRVMSHHGSLAADIRQSAESRLKSGNLKALVATASLELGIDIGDVDLVCQLGAPRSIATFLQRVGRAGHRIGAVPKGRLFPLSRDELVVCAAVLEAVGRGELDALCIPEQPLDILAQQIVAESSCQEELAVDALFDLLRRAYPFRHLSRSVFDSVVDILAHGAQTGRGRRAGRIHFDAVNGRIRGRKGARLAAITSGGAIPERADYRVVQRASGTFVGTVDEDFAIESMAGDIFQLGNTSWRIHQVVGGKVYVEDARGQPPTMPFWLGEAPARTDELSAAVSRLRQQAECAFAGGKRWPLPIPGVSAAALEQLRDYFGATRRSLGVLPSQETLVAERFFDESGGMQLVIHSTFGARINRAWGLALRKRFCRSFNFELQAAAGDDALILSLGESHSFPLDQVFRFLHSETAKDVLIQALLDAPMFQVRWRWNVARSLLLLRFRGGKRVPPFIQRMEAEDYLAAVFPDTLACLENIVGDRELPDHPIVQQTVADCLSEAMDVEGFVGLLEKIERGSVRVEARDLSEPSPACHEILNAKPYAFLDDAPLEERRARAVYQRRGLDATTARSLGALDDEAIASVRREAWPTGDTDDEVHDALLTVGALTRKDAREGGWVENLERLQRAGRAMSVAVAPEHVLWVAAERRALIAGAFDLPALCAGQRIVGATPKDRPTAIADLLRGRLESTGPTTSAALQQTFGLPATEIDLGLNTLEVQGAILRGHFRAGVSGLEWCDRRLLARIHRRTLGRLRAQIEPVSPEVFARFLANWQRLGDEKARSSAGVLAVLSLLDGFEAPARVWEEEILPARVAGYQPAWLDQLCQTGQITWGRLSRGSATGGNGPLPTSPIALCLRDSREAWLPHTHPQSPPPTSGKAQRVADVLQTRGALFYRELQRVANLIDTELEEALAELVATGWATADSFAGLRALLRRAGMRRNSKPRSRGAFGPAMGLELAGRWWLLRREDLPPPAAQPSATPDNAGLQRQALALLRRYGVIFRKLLERESLTAPWRDLLPVLRQLEARGQIRGGHFVSGFSGEHFALPEAVGTLRKLRNAPPTGQLVRIAAADPLNLTGILFTDARVPATLGGALLLCDGLPVATARKGNIERLGNHETPDLAQITRAFAKARKSAPRF